MRIATFNANSVRSRMEVILAWGDTCRADVLCLQETKVQDADFPRAPLEAAGWSVAFRGEKAYNGVAVLSRVPPDEALFGFDDGGPADPTRLAWVRFGPLTVVNTYVPQGRELDHPMYAYKQAWFRRLKRLFAGRARPDDLLVWVGDLNVAREPIDVYEPEKHEDHVCYHADVRHAFEETLAWGFVDVYRRFHPGETGRYTFYDYRLPAAMPRARGWRLDYILATHPLAERATGCEIDLEPRKAPKPSDHTFTYADFDV